MQKSFPEQSLGQCRNECNFDQQPDKGFNSGKHRERVVKSDAAWEKAATVERGHAENN